MAGHVPPPVAQRKPVPVPHCNRPPCPPPVPARHWPCAQPALAVQAKYPAVVQKMEAAGRDYPPMTVAQAIRQAEAAAWVWNHNGRAGTNFGNQGAEYILAGNITNLKQRWRAKGPMFGDNLVRKASDSVSAIGANVDLKLAPDENQVSVFNYHVAVDVQKVKKVNTMSNKAWKKVLSDYKGKVIPREIYDRRPNA